MFPQGTLTEGWGRVSAALGIVVALLLAAILAWALRHRRRRARRAADKASAAAATAAAGRPPLPLLGSGVQEPARYDPRWPSVRVACWGGGCATAAWASAHLTCTRNPPPVSPKTVRSPGHSMVLVQAGAEGFGCWEVCVTSGPVAPVGVGLHWYGPGAGGGGADAAEGSDVSAPWYAQPDARPAPRPLPLPIGGGGERGRRVAWDGRDHTPPVVWQRPSLCPVQMQSPRPRGRAFRGMRGWVSFLRGGNPRTLRRTARPHGGQGCRRRAPPGRGRRRRRGRPPASPTA